MEFDEFEAGDIVYVGDGGPKRRVLRIDGDCVTLASLGNHRSRSCYREYPKVVHRLCLHKRPVRVPSWRSQMIERVPVLSARTYEEMEENRPTREDVRYPKVYRHRATTGQ